MCIFKTPKIPQPEPFKLPAVAKEPADPSRRRRRTTLRALTGVLPGDLQLTGPRGLTGQANTRQRGTVLG